MRLRIARARDRLAVRAFLNRLSPATIQERYLSQHTSLSGLVGDREVARMLALLRGSGRRLQLTSTYGSQYFRLQLERLEP
jgi:hypothetical protein